jgi:hypothetical protein
VENNLGEIVTALILLIVRFFERRHLLKAKKKEKFEALDSNTKYYRSIIDEINKNKNSKF